MKSISFDEANERRLAEDPELRRLFDAEVKVLEAMTASSKPTTSMIPAPAGPALPSTLDASTAAAVDFAKSSIPKNTQRAYTSDWNGFATWCKSKGVNSLPADPRVIAAFLADESARRAPTSLRRCLSALGKAHEVAGHLNPCRTPTVQTTIKGIEKTYGTAAVGKDAATLTVVTRMIAACPGPSLDAVRSRAMILLGYATACRRSELCNLDMADLKWSLAGVEVTVRFGKKDQTGKGLKKAIPFNSGGLCACAALTTWLTLTEIDSGPVFRGFNRNGLPKDAPLGAASYANIIKSAALRAGLDPSAFSGHSTRSGHVTEARARGVDDADTMATTGHTRRETLDIYDRRGNAFKHTSAGAVLRPGPRGAFGSKETK